MDCLDRWKEYRPKSGSNTCRQIDHDNVTYIINSKNAIAYTIEMHAFKVKDLTKNFVCKTQCESNWIRIICIRNSIQINDMLVE